MESKPDTDSERMIALYIAAMKRNFGDESWAQVELYAQSAWASCRMDSDPEWPEVRERLKDAWCLP